MTFAELKNTLAGLRLHDLAETNVLDVRSDGTRCILAGDESEIEELRAELKAAQDAAAQHDKDADAAEARAEEAERKQEAAEKLLSEFRDEGGTLLYYIKRADQAKGLAEAWHKQAERVEKEVTALRKRRGAWPGYFAAQGRVYALLGSLASQPHGSPFKAEAEKIIETLRKP